MLNMFIVLPMASGAMVTALVALALGIAGLVAAVAASRLSFGREFRGN